MPPRKVPEKVTNVVEPVVEEEQIAPPAPEPDPPLVIEEEPSPAPEPVAEPEPAPVEVPAPTPEPEPAVVAGQAKRGGWTIDPDKGWVAD